jgi:hypothetical protein
VPSLHELAETARSALVLCSVAIEEAATPGKDLLDLRRTLTAPRRYWKLLVARRHRARARRHLARLHEGLHDMASLGVHNADLWSAITRSVDALALSRWLNADSLAPEDLAPAAETVHLLLRELTDLIALLHELAWPDEMPSGSLLPT